MKRFSQCMPIIAAISAMLALILDSANAIQAAAEAIEVCLRTAVPTLFPFFVLSAYLVPYAVHLRLPLLGKLLGIPDGWESIFLLGCVGGYPVGAQCVAQGYSSGKLEEYQAKRMLGFCTNCGPSFLFGIVGAAFEDAVTPLVIMLIGIGSAMLVGAFWPASNSLGGCEPDNPKIPLPQAVQQAIRSMASVCAWVILGKILLAFLQKCGLAYLPSQIGMFLSGLLELTNGCLALGSYTNEDLRLVIACAITSFGGLCVAMQVASLCNRVGLDWGCYLPQKAFQSGIAAAMAVLYLLIPGHWCVRLIILMFIWCYILILSKKTVEIPGRLVYNNSKSNQGGT